MDQADTLRDLMGSKSIKENKTRIITVTSGKGGVGKTNLSVNLALAYANIGKKVVLMDADLGLANVNIILGIVPKFNLQHVISKQKKISEVTISTSYGIDFISGATGFSKMANLEEEDRKYFIQEILTLSYADIIIIDTSAGLSTNVLAFISIANEILVVTTPEPTSVTDAYGIIKVSATEIDRNTNRLYLVINRVKNETHALEVSNNLKTIASKFLNLNVNYLGYVVDDKEVSDAVFKQVPFYINSPKSKASFCMNNIVRRLENLEVDKEQFNITNIFKNFFKK